MTEALSEGYDPGNGFALDEYLVSRHGPAPGIKGGTMAKATNVAGGIVDELAKSADKAPGPGYYFKDALDKNFVKFARGGTFSRLTRDGNKSKDHTPSVGQYDTNIPPSKTRGGLMSRNDRVCAFAKMAERTNLWNPNGPGKYDPKIADKHRASPNFVSPRTESRNPKKASQVGPGYYNPSFAQVDFKPPAYSTSKEESGTFMNRQNKDRNALPFPWYKDMPDSKVHDRLGTRKHCKKLLKDRHITPRSKRYTVSPRDDEVSPHDLPDSLNIPAVALDTLPDI